MSICVLSTVYFITLRFFRADLAFTVPKTEFCRSLLLSVRVYKLFVFRAWSLATVSHCERFVIMVFIWRTPPPRCPRCVLYPREKNSLPRNRSYVNAPYLGLKLMHSQYRDTLLTWQVLKYSNACINLSIQPSGIKSEDRPKLRSLSRCAELSETALKILSDNAPMTADKRAQLIQS